VEKSHGNMMDGEPWPHIIDSYLILAVSPLLPTMSSFSFGSTRAVSWMVAMMQIGEAVLEDAAPQWRGGSRTVDLVGMVTPSSTSSNDGLDLSRLVARGRLEATTGHGHRQSLSLSTTPFCFLDL
jgi:hypothetical protein